MAEDDDAAAAVPIDRPAGDRTVFVTGATGYIGGRLVPKLLERGWRVRCLSRSARKLEGRPWANDERIEIVEGDAGDVDTLTDAMRGCEGAYYLVHSMMAAGDAYREHDLRLARSFGEAATNAGVPRIVYLGGLGETGEHLSEHLSSRREVEEALRETHDAVTVLRAAMIIGSGSASFEILRYLVERLPVMVTPRWVRTESQPIAVRNVIHYLAACLEVPETADRTLEIGGADVHTYRELMRIMAEERGLPKRWVIPVPVLTPRLSSLWIHLVTPISARLGRPLAEGLRNRVVADDAEARRLMPQELLTAREAISAALGKVSAAEVETMWSDAGTMPGDPDWSGGTTFRDARSMEVRANAVQTFRAACRIGGGQGYYAADWLWRLRGVMDRLVGGPGLRRGRKNPEHVSYGEALDFWRVTGLETGRLLELRAEMKVPGVATLTFEFEPIDQHRSRLVQTARFKPKGLVGLLYWWSVKPLHQVVFNGMMRGIARSAEEAARRAVDSAHQVKRPG